MTAARRALVIGIDDYTGVPGCPNLTAAAQDAARVAALLKLNDDGSRNWEVELLTDLDGWPVTKDRLADALERHFQFEGVADDSDVDLLIYFSGHAVQVRRGATWLMAHDDDRAYPFNDLMTGVDSSRARTVTVILDCCTSGDAGNVATRDNDPFAPERALLTQDVSILTASRASEDAQEHPVRGGLFSQGLIGGLQGAAADLLGRITPLSLYSHASSSMDQRGQHPTFKSHAVRPVVLRYVEPQIPVDRLGGLSRLFPLPTSKVHLTVHHEGVATDPRFIDRSDPDRKAFTGSDGQIELDFLKELRDTRLVRTDDGRDFYFLCNEPDDTKNTISLTPLGQYYWELVKNGGLHEGIP